MITSAATHGSHELGRPVSENSWSQKSRRTGRRRPVRAVLYNSRERSKLSFEMLVRRLLLTNTIDLLRKLSTVVGVPLLSQYWVDMVETCDIIRTSQINELSNGEENAATCAASESSMTTSPFSVLFEYGKG